MGMENFKLGAFAGAFAVVARAAPQKEVNPIFPIRNVTTPTLGPTGSTCEAKCSVYYPEISAMSWVPEYQIVYTTEITVGTVSIIITTESKNVTLSSRTHTVYGDVPTEYSLWMRSTDADGRAVVSVPLTLSDGYTLSRFIYPTPYLDYSTEYHWEGVLPTNDKDLNPVCATASPEPANGILPQHPEYPQPKEVGPGKEDPLGAEHQPLWVPTKDEPDKAFFDAAFPSESAFSYCESAPRKTAVPTQFSAPKFVFDTTTAYTIPNSLDIIHDESTVTGWEETTKEPSKTFGRSLKSPHLESTADGWEEWPEETPTGLPDNQPAIPRIQSTASGFEQLPGAHQSGSPDKPSQGGNAPKPDVPGAILSLISPKKPSAQPFAPTPAPVLAAATPVFTFVPTVVGGRTNTIPAFILPDSSATATIGQSVTINGQPTVLAAPPAIFTFVATTINGVATSAPAFIISGTSTANIGQTVTLNGQPTVLAAPPAAFTMLPTTINGIATSVPAYIISGSITAYPGQTVTLNGQATVLAEPTPTLTMIPTTINGVATSVPVYIISGSITATPGQTVTINGQETILPTLSAIFTSVTTTINGKATVIPAYIISGSITATIGQTVTIGGKTTVLSTPTGTDGIATRFGGPASTSAGEQPQATGSGVSSEGAAVERSRVSWSAALVGIGAMLLVRL